MINTTLHNELFNIGISGFLLSMVLVGIGGRTGSLLYATTQSTMLFRRRISGRAGSLIAGAFVLLLATLTIIDAVSNGIRSHSWHNWGWFPAVALAWMYVLTSALFLYLSGPADLLLDLDKRTYQLTVGWPWSPKVTSGSFQNIKSIILKQPGGNLGGCSARMLWRDSQNKVTYLLGRFSNEEQAEKLARDLSQVLDFSRND